MTENEGRKFRILLVEDNLTDAILLRTLLEDEEDVRVTLAQDGIRGCQLAENQKWGLVVTDINLPGRDGIDVIQAVKASQPDTPIVATSAYSAPAYTESAFRNGANEVLTKPIDRDELLRTVRDLLEVKARADSVPGRILALGAFPGDVEVGCGGLLLKHVQNGDRTCIMACSLGVGGQDTEERRLEAQRAANVLGAELALPEDHPTDLPDLDRMVIRIKDLVHELEPDVVYAPSANDVRESRLAVYKAAEIAAESTRGFCCYQAATTTLDFRPTIFEDVSEFLDQKMAALSHYEGQVKGRPHLDPELARATARYWGRFVGYGEVEPLEVVRQLL
jgi:CheY-like chemotaxis protein